MLLVKQYYTSVRELMKNCKCCYFKKSWNQLWKITSLPNVFIYVSKLTFLVFKLLLVVIWNCRPALWTCNRNSVSQDTSWELSVTRTSVYNLAQCYCVQLCMVVWTFWMQTGEQMRVILRTTFVPNSGFKILCMVETILKPFGSSMMVWTVHVVNDIVYHD